MRRGGLEGWTGHFRSYFRHLYGGDDTRVEHDGLLERRAGSLSLHLEGLWTWWRRRLGSRRCLARLLCLWCSWHLDVAAIVVVVRESDGERGTRAVHRDCAVNNGDLFVFTVVCPRDVRRKVGRDANAGSVRNVLGRRRNRRCSCLGAQHVAMSMRSRPEYCRRVGW